MHPIPFKGQTQVVAENQPEYLPMPIFAHDDGPIATATACWKLSLMERIVLLFTGRLWVSTMTFGRTFLPQMFRVTKPTEIKE